MSSENPNRECAPMNAGGQPLRIMTAIADEGGLTNGEIYALIGIKTDASARNALHNLSAKGWIKKVYVLTAEGRDALNRCEDDRNSN